MSATTTCPTCDATLRTRGSRWIISLLVTFVGGVVIGRLL